MSEPITLKSKKKDRLNKDESYGDQVRFFSKFSPAGKAAQDRIGKAKVTVFGAGALGSHALEALADSGVGAIRVIDSAATAKRDIVGNPMLSIDDVGRARAEAAALRINQREIPAVRCEAVSAETDSDDKLKEIIHGADCALVCLDSPAPALLDSVNRVALEVKLRWIAAQVYQGVGLVGPAVIPYQSPCYRCYELRRNANLENYEEILHYETRLREMPAIRSEFIAPKPMAALLGGALALEALRLITQAAVPQTAGRILRVDFFAQEMTYHRLLRLPNCPACGSGESTVRRLS